MPFWLEPSNEKAETKETRGLISMESFWLAITNEHSDSVNSIDATGLSNGAIMSHYVGSELSDRIAAISTVGGPLMMPAPRNSRPVPVMHFHGTADAFAPFSGGYGKNALGGKGVTVFRSVDHTIQQWVKANGCSATPEVDSLPDVTEDGMSVKRKTYRGGLAGSEVVLIEIQNGGHTWPGQKPIVSLLGESKMDISANDLMWDFFQQHPLPGNSPSSDRNSKMPAAASTLREFP